jgi:hypothetical protein
MTVWQRLTKHATGIRRLVAACFFAAALVLILVSSFTRYVQTCTDQIARVGTVPAVRSCEPMSITAAPIIVLLIGTVLLLLPDVSSVEIPGVVRIENQIKEQARRQEQLIGLVQNIRISQGQYTIIGLSEIAELLRRLPEKTEGFDDTGP